MSLSLDAKYYADPVFHRAEQDKIFRPSWQIVGHESTLRKPGAYRTLEIGNVGLFVIRGPDGTLRGFKNVCRHRGSRLLEQEQGMCAEIRCPYHDWRYDGLGNLRATPWFDEPTPFDMANLSLIPVAIEEWRGLVFVSLEPGVSLLAQLGGLPDALVDVPIETMVEGGTDDYEAPLNWKTYLDQFNEYYHSPAVHAPDKAVGLDRYRVAPFSNGMCMTAPPGEVYYGGKWLWSWPNWTISTFPGGAKVSRVMPLAEERIAVRFLYLFEDSSPGGEQLRQQVIDATRNIFAEDVVACLRVQRNLTARTYVPGPLHPRLEVATAYFQHLIRSALKGTP